jgi:16S rRNA C967 or C1407 C5-methylase (RsmB/RsmF family)
VSKRQLKKAPGLKKLHQAMVQLETAGLITRQEAVSMVPPLFLDVRAEHVVFDMCASPGSKTSQILDDMHALNPNPTGFIVANELDRKRAYLLAHQITRFVNIASLVTTHDGSLFPTLRTRLVGGLGQTMFFDRVLADVPCSGEGTIRKNGDVCTKWAPGAAIGFHKLQLAIAKRGANQLAVGGRMVYSTCSLNPLENEAVVAELLRLGNGQLALLDVSAEVPQLLRRPGMKRWPVAGFGQEGYFDKPSDVPADSRTAGALPSIFCQDDLESLHIERCMRFYPHLQDTGGFFVAVIVKTSAVAGLAAPLLPALSTPLLALDMLQFVQPGRHVREHYTEDPLKPVLLRSDVIADLKAAFDLTDDAIAVLQYRHPTFAVQPNQKKGGDEAGGDAGDAPGKPKSIFGLTSKLATLSNCGEIYSTLFAVNAGAKLFELKKARDTKVPTYAILASAATVLLSILPPHRIVRITGAELLQLIDQRSTDCSMFEQLAPADRVQGSILFKVDQVAGRPTSCPIGFSGFVRGDRVSISVEKGDLVVVRQFLAGFEITIDRTKLDVPPRTRDNDDWDNNDDNDDDNDNDDTAAVADNSAKVARTGAADDDDE